ncbi:MAG: hypothetical protein AAB400_03165 [Patescibacteria group bacterium]|mgnify:CR=1 FL=1
MSIRSARTSRLPLTDERFFEIREKATELLQTSYASKLEVFPKEIDEIPPYIRKFASELSIQEDEFLAFLMHAGLLYALELRRHYTIVAMDHLDISDVLNQVSASSDHGNILLFNLDTSSIKALVDKHASGAGIDASILASALTGFICLVSELLIEFHNKSAINITLVEQTKPSIAPYLDLVKRLRKFSERLGPWIDSDGNVCFNVGSLILMI